MDKSLLLPKLPLYIKDKKSLFFILIIFVLMHFLPWKSFSVGIGQITAIDPNERVQTITSPISGFITEWLVTEGKKVKKGQIIARLQDIDPSLLERLTREKQAAQNAVESSKLMLDTSKINLKRQQKLYREGLSARKDFEKAKIETSKMAVEYSKSLATLTKAETQVSRQMQEVKAPRDGIITRIQTGERGVLIKAGSPLAIMTPDITTFGVEIWIDGNDSSMISLGQPVRLQFEGWPAIQIPGWPSIAIGTFKGRVALVDPASSYKGKFRVLIRPDEQWPRSPFLRQGIHTKGYIYLANSFILKEIWRQLTGFPPVLAPIKDEMNQLLKTKDFEEDKKEEKK